MGFKLTGGVSAVDSDVDSAVKALRTTLVSRGVGFCVSTTTGTIGAALAANSPVFGMRLDPSATVRAFIERVRLQFTTIVAFTTPVTAGRRLALFRGSGAATAGGTGIATAQRKHTAFGSTSEFDTANGGDLRIATTAALTVVGITFETEPLRMMTLTHVGAAGGHYECIWEFHASENNPVVLEPGQLLAIRNPAAMDAAGTWTLAVNVDWHEAAAF
jgi:hypothetical protein